jgi:hypothetical protein
MILENNHLNTISSSLGNTDSWEDILKEVSHMRSRLMRFVLIILIAIIGFPLISSAKCPKVKYVVKGTVKLWTTKVPVADARVLVFYDDNKNFESAFYDQIPRSFYSGKSGDFEVVAMYPSLEGGLLWQDGTCAEIPKKIELIFISGNNVAREIIPIGKVAVEKGLDSGVIKVPDIFVMW